MSAWNPSTLQEAEAGGSVHLLAISRLHTLSLFLPLSLFPSPLSLAPSLPLYLSLFLSPSPTLSYKDIFQTKLGFKLRENSCPPQSRAPSDVPTTVMTAMAETSCWYTSHLWLSCHLTIRHRFVSCCGFLIACSNVLGLVIFRVLQLKLSIEKYCRSH